jgi:Uma2 family endonuclease
MSYALVPEPVTIAAFDAFTEAQPDNTRWDLVDGQIVAMTNPSEDHGQIAMNLAVRLRTAADQSGCRVNVNGLRVQASEDQTATTATIPDIVVRCGPRVDRHWITDPVIVVEVLSPSTEHFDRGPKLAFYKTLPSLQDIVIVYQDELRIEHYVRAGDIWARKPLTALSSQLDLVGLLLSIRLSDIYAGTGLV